MGVKQSTMETLVDLNLFNGTYFKKKVFITGNTGFKGSWLAFWLIKMGAIVKGYALKENTTPAHFSMLNCDYETVIGNILDEDRLRAEIDSFKPEIVFHLAAQPLVRDSYDDPITTYKTNVIGTLNVFESCRKVSSIKAIVNITTDKCYENNEWVYGYRESDKLGGYDPYSSSKACSEILTASFRNSFLNIEDYGKKHSILLASVRAGNVIGGGDWAKDRLIPDIMVASNKKEITEIRNPVATRPWQHVLEPLSGYLLLGSKLLEGHIKFADCWNFGPNDISNLTVKEVCDLISKYWTDSKFHLAEVSKGPHEAGLLKLDCSKSNTYLKWKPVWNNDEMFCHTALWYKNYYSNGIINTDKDLNDYISDAINQKQSWCNGNN